MNPYDICPFTLCSGQPHPCLRFACKANVAGSCVFVDAALALTGIGQALDGVEAALRDLNKGN